MPNKTTTIEPPIVQHWTFYDHFFSSIFYSTGTVGISVNIYLIYLILAKSPSSLHVYRVFLLNVAIAELVFSASCTFAQIRLIPNKWAFAYVPLGPSRLFGAQVSYWAYVIQLHSLFHVFLSFPFSFGFRYYVLVHPTPTVRQCVRLCLCLWAFALAQLVCFVFSESPHLEIFEYLAVNKPDYDLRGWPISGNHMINEPLTSITLATIVLPMFPIYCVVMYFYKKVKAFLMDNTTNMREGTIKGHRRLLLALTIQASLPVFFVFPPISIYGLYHLEIINFTIIEYLVYSLFSFLPAVSPLVTIYFIKPYNMAVRSMLGMRSAEILPKTSTAIEKQTRYSSSQI